MYRFEVSRDAAVRFQKNLPDILAVFGASKLEFAKALYIPEKELDRYWWPCKKEMTIPLYIACRFVLAACAEDWRIPCSDHRQVCEAALHLLTEEPESRMEELRLENAKRLIRQLRKRYPDDSDSYNLGCTVRANLILTGFLDPRPEQRKVLGFSQD